jgi:hypothetical protein
MPKLAATIPSSTGPARRAPRATPIVLALVALVAFGGPALAEERVDEKGYRCSDDPSLVYLGNPKLFQKPAVVSSDRVYRQIPEYREILDKGLTTKDVRYHFLLKKASEKFSKAVKASAREHDHDLVAEIGAVTAGKEATAPPDRTDDVIQRLS